MMQFFLHVTCSCIFHAYILFYFLLLCCDVFLSLCFSLSWIDCTWLPRCANLLLAGILFKVLVLPLLLIIFPLFTFDSMMRKPKRTSRRTSKNVVFIRSAESFSQTFPTLRYQVSFVLGDGILSMRNPCDVLSCLHRISTPIYMVLIPLYLSLRLTLEVYVS